MLMFCLLLLHIEEPFIYRFLCLASSGFRHHLLKTQGGCCSNGGNGNIILFPVYLCTVFRYFPCLVLSHSSIYVCRALICSDFEEAAAINTMHIKLNFANCSTVY
ncbi:hypothetical protein ABZP36_000042 [Zizania latifolia]